GFGRGPAAGEPQARREGDIEGRSPARAPGDYRRGAPGAPTVAAAGAGTADRRHRVAEGRGSPASGRFADDDRAVADAGRWTAAHAVRGSRPQAGPSAAAMISRSVAGRRPPGRTSGATRPGAGRRPSTAFQGTPRLPTTCPCL